MDAVEHEGEAKVPASMDFDNYEPGCRSKLREKLNLQDVCSTSGTQFEIAENEANDLEFRDDFNDEPEPEPEEVTKDLNIAMCADEERNDQDRSPFEILATRMEDITEEKSGKVRKKILRSGVGGVVPAGSLVRVHYSGRLEYSDQPFDSSYLQNKNRPRVFILGDGTWLPGLDLAVSTMRKDEISMFLIHHDYYMGELGCPPRIPPAATVLFRIELDSFSDRKDVHEYYTLPVAERKDASIDTILKVINVEKQEGKEHFKNHRYRSAYRKYKKAIRILEDCHLADEEAETKMKAALVVLYRNAALCALRVHEPSPAIRLCNEALRIERKSPKALYIKGKALIQQGEFQEAERVLIKAKGLSPNDPDITAALQELEKKANQFKSMEKSMCQNMMKGLSKKDDSNNKKEPVVAEKPDPAAEDRPPNVSEEFEQRALEQLRLFKEDASQKVLPFPSSMLTIDEITCLLDVACRLDIHVDRAGEGPNAHFRFSKEKGEDSNARMI